MKDIIAAQQIQRRPKGSLLSSAQKYRGIADNSFIADQRLSKQNAKRLLELVREKSASGKSAAQNLGFLQKPDAPRNRAGRGAAEQKPREQKTRNGSAFSSAFQTAFTALAQNPKRTLAGLLGCLFVLCFAVFSFRYIPDPEPPEDRVILEQAGLTDLSAAGDEIPLDLTEVFAWQHYTVQPGDAVETIAKRFGLSLDAVIASNNLRNVRRLQAAEAIRIPNMDGIPYTVRKGDSYAKIAASFEVPLEAVLDANDIQSDAITAGTVLFIPGARMDRTALREALGEFFVWPISGRRTSAFGWRNDPFTGTRSFHAALDISAPMGTAVRAASDGRVSSVGYNAVYGNFVIVTHSAEYQSMYAHLDRILVKTGTYVDQGAIIARSGNTGRSTGPHLHFSVYKNKRAINPLEVLNH